MKYISLDVETTCLNDRDVKNLIAFSMIVEDTAQPEVPVEDLPHLTCLVKQPTYKGEAYALAMNSWIFDQLSGRTEAKYPIIKNEFVMDLKISNFLNEHFDIETITVAGCQVGTFDLKFLPPVIQKQFHYRTLELSSVCWNPEHYVPLGLADRKREFGVEGPVTHDPWDDAADVIRIMRARFSR